MEFLVCPTLLLLATFECNAVYQVGALAGNGMLACVLDRCCSTFEGIFKQGTELTLRVGVNSPQGFGGTVMDLDLWGVRYTLVVPSVRELLLVM